MKTPGHLVLALSLALGAARAAIDRKAVVQSFNPRRTDISRQTPMQLGNGNFAFGADITGLQTFAPFATLSTWAWHNFSLPDTPGQTSPSDFAGLNLTTHGRPVNYNQPGEDEDEISQWLRENPHRINLGTVSFFFDEPYVTMDNITDHSQELDLWTGTLTSRFSYKGAPVTVVTRVHPELDTLAVRVESELLLYAALGIVFDYPYPTTEKFSAPYVGVYNQTAEHESDGVQFNQQNALVINHSLGDTEYGTYVSLGSDVFSRSSPTNHYYIATPVGVPSFNFTATFTSADVIDLLPNTEEVEVAATEWWESYWTESAFIDMTATGSPEADELQRRTILSQYLVAVNSASDLPPQESGLVNTGWYGKFHMEMYLWHSLQFARWNHWPLLWRSLNDTYNSLLPGAYSRAEKQGYEGARWGKMTGSDLNDAPGEINSLLIWQQPHPMYFAEVEYRSFPTEETLQKWDEILTATADFMASFAFYNETSGLDCYELGPPMYPVSENTDPAETKNPTFELAYWRFGLEIAAEWKRRQDLPVPEAYETVLEKLCPLPVVDGTYPVYEGIPDMWTDSATTMDHPAMTGVFGLLPPPRTGEPLDLGVVEKTADKVLETWDFEQSFGWDFPMLAMNALRLGNETRAVEYLLHPNFEFDDVGYAVGGSRVPTPYFPGSSSLLLAMAMMAGGWDGEEGMHFPEGWDVTVEGFTAGL